MTREHAASPNDPVRPEPTDTALSSTINPSPSDPPRMVLNRRVHEAANALNRAGVEVPGLPALRHWNRYVSPLAVHLAGPALAAQGNDLARGLLLFAEGKPARADDSTVGWIAAHLAACFGFEHPDDGERVAWAEERGDLWRRIAQDPAGNMSWAEAPRPWSALAAAIEFADYLAHPGTAFPSRLPVTLTSVQLGGPKLGVTAMSETAVFLSASAAAAYGLTFVPFGPGLYATHAADCWLLSATVMDAFALLGAHAQIDEFWPRSMTAPLSGLTPPTLM